MNEHLRLDLFRLIEVVFGNDLWNSGPALGQWLSRGGGSSVARGKPAGTPLSKSRDMA